MKYLLWMVLFFPFLSLTAKSTKEKEIASMENNASVDSEDTLALNTENLSEASLQLFWS